MQRASVAQFLKTAGLILIWIGVLARIGAGLYAVASDPSLAWFSLRAMDVLVSGWRGVDMPFLIGLPYVAVPVGLGLWLAGWLLRPRVSTS